MDLGQFEHHAERIALAEGDESLSGLGVIQPAVIQLFGLRQGKARRIAQGIEIIQAILGDDLIDSQTSLTTEVVIIRMDCLVFTRFPAVKTGIA